MAALTTLPGLGAGTLWDNSETTYGEVAREILLSNDWIVLHLNTFPWFVQPPLYFWTAALFAKIFGVSELTLRLPSALATIATSAAVGYVAARVATPRAAVLAALAVSTFLMQAVVGRLAIMDAMLDLAVAVAILGWFMVVRTGEGRCWLPAWVALACGTLAKGLVAPVLVLLVAAAWWGWERATRRDLRVPPTRAWIAGAALFAVLVGPWALALGAAAGPAAFAQLVGHYTIGRYLGTIENQSGPFWYYVPVVILGVFPWFPFLIPAALAGWRDALGDASPSGSLSRLALVWAIVPFAFFSLARTKLPNYIALELPAFAILIGVWFDRVVQRPDRRVALAWTAIVPVTVVAVGFALYAFSRTNRVTSQFHEVATILAVLGALILVGSIACFGLLLLPRTAWLAPFVLGGVTVCVMIAIAGAEPLVERFKPIPQLAAIIRRDLRPGDVIAIQGVPGGNALIFYTRPHVARLALPGEPHLAPNDPRRTICSASRVFLIAAKKRAAPYPTFGRIRHAVAVSNKDALFLIDGPPCV